MKKYWDEERQEWRLQSEPDGTDWFDDASNFAIKELEEEMDKKFLEIVESCLNKETFVKMKYIPLPPMPTLEQSVEEIRRHHKHMLKNMAHGFGKTEEEMIQYLIELDNNKSSNENKYKCLVCGKKAQWIRFTQFSGNHHFCLEHAKEEKDFHTSDTSYGFWEEIKDD